MTLLITLKFKLTWIKKYFSMSSFLKSLPSKTPKNPVPLNSSVNSKFPACSPLLSRIWHSTSCLSATTKLTSEESSYTSILHPNQSSVILSLKPPPESLSSSPFPFKTLPPKTGGSKPHSQKIKKAKNLVTCL